MNIDGFTSVMELPNANVSESQMLELCRQNACNEQSYIFLAIDFSGDLALTRRRMK